MNHVALYGARPHDRDLDDEIIEFLRLETRQHVHLRAALDLENAKTVALLQHSVDGRVFLRNVGKAVLFPIMRREQLERLANAGQHSQRQHIDLHQAQRINVVLVPFDEGAVRHRCILHGHQFVQSFAGQHEAADVL